MKKGLVSTEFFKEVCRAGKKEKEEETIKSYLLALDLAAELENGTLFIPSLVSDDNRVSKKKKKYQMKT